MKEKQILENTDRFLDCFLETRNLCQFIPHFFLHLSPKKERKRANYRFATPSLSNIAALLIKNWITMKRSPVVSYSLNFPWIWILHIKYVLYNKILHMEYWGILYIILSISWWLHCFAFLRNRYFHPPYIEYLQWVLEVEHCRCCSLLYSSCQASSWSSLAPVSGSTPEICPLGF